jgi:hypothetical protein
MAPSLETSEIYILDSAGFSQPVTTGLPTPRVRHSPSPVLSDSSEDIVIFRGRGTSKDRLREPFQIHDRTLRSQQSRGISSIKTWNNPESGIRHQTQASALKDLELTTSKIENPALYSQTQPFTSLPLRTASWFAENDYATFNAGGPSRARRRRQRYHVGVKSEEDEEDEEIIRDYIDNIRSNQDEPEGLPISVPDQHNLLSSGLDFTDKNTGECLSKAQTSSSSNRGRVCEFRDFNEIGTSNEPFEAVEVILSMRERPTGRQYLVVWQGRTSEDAQWVSLPVLIEAGASDSIALFEARESLEVHSESTDNSASDSDSDDDLVHDLEEDFRDAELEELFLENLQAGMSDEQIAQRLAKQEELGLGSTEIRLFDGYEPVDSSSEELNVLPREQALEYGSVFSSTQKQSRIRRTPISTYTCFLDDDQYDGFDVMDRDRPSLHRRTKNRRHVPSFENSDPDLEISTQLAWENDRKKKRLQKQQRQELRTQGLLGKGGKLDMKAKYPEGMTTTELKLHIKEFLSSDKMRYDYPFNLHWPGYSLQLLSTTFPPMDKSTRLVVHNFANALNLKSKSMGVGKNRHPVLYKTARTTPYSESLLENIVVRLNRGFLPRTDRRGKQSNAIRNTGAKRGGGIGTSVSYRDGEIVGAAAPEIGAENRGRAMLEKMGWSTGTALGALNNKGIMQPVLHVVKTTKAGLG